VRGHVSYPYEIQSKVIFSYILIFTFLDSRREDKTFWTAWKQTIYKLSVLNFLINEILICYYHSQIYELCHIFKLFISYVYIIILVTRNEQFIILQTYAIKIITTDNVNINIISLHFDIAFYC
jgi:hypothetical protein